MMVMRRRIISTQIKVCRGDAMTMQQLIQRKESQMMTIHK
jgi:hypothetical protein